MSKPTPLHNICALPDSCLCPAIKKPVHSSNPLSQDVPLETLFASHQAPAGSLLPLHRSYLLQPGAPLVCAMPSPFSDALLQTKRGGWRESHGTFSPRRLSPLPIAAASPDSTSVS